LGTNAFALENMNYMITCSQKNPEMRAVILSSNAGSILGRKVAVTAPAVFLHDWNTVVGTSKLNIVSKRYDADSRTETIDFTSANGSFAEVAILGLEEDFTPGKYAAEVTLGIYAGGFAMQGKSLTCEALIDRAKNP
jgi:hypothetical protein